MKRAFPFDSASGPSPSEDLLYDGPSGPKMTTPSSELAYVWDALYATSRTSGTAPHTVTQRGYTKELRSFQGLRGSAVDYLHTTLHKPPTPSWEYPELQKLILVTLYKLCKSHLLYPRCYILKGIDIESHESGGGFSDVYKGRLGEQQLCLKVIRINKRSDTEALLKVFYKEAILWGALCHPNILPFYGVYYRDEACRQICLVSPWLPNGNVVEYLNAYPSKPRLMLVCDVALGLEYLHQRGLVHGDIKGANVLVDDNERACLADFGLSSVRTDQTVARCFSATTVQGVSLRWAAPELLGDSPKPTAAGDMWSFGCVCYEIISGKQPFGGLSDVQAIRQLIVGKAPADLETSFRASIVTDPLWATTTVGRVIGLCWNRDPEQRPKWEDVVRVLLPMEPDERSWKNDTGSSQAGQEVQLVRLNIMKQSDEGVSELDVNGIGRILIHALDSRVTDQAVQSPPVSDGTLDSILPSTHLIYDQPPRPLPPDSIPLTAATDGPDTSNYNPPTSSQVRSLLHPAPHHSQSGHFQGRGGEHEQGGDDRWLQCESTADAQNEHDVLDAAAMVKSRARRESKSSDGAVKFKQVHASTEGEVATTNGTFDGSLQVKISPTTGATLDNLTRNSLYASDPTNISPTADPSQVMAAIEASTDEVGSQDGTQALMCPLYPCDCLFRKKEDLTKHVKTHLMERRYMCSVCQKRFSKSENLLQHLRAHERATGVVGVGIEGDEGLPVGLEGWVHQMLTTQLGEP